MVERWSGVESLVDESAVSDVGGLQSDAFMNALGVSLYSTKGVSFMLIV